jgi:hypothetical protein
MDPETGNADTSGGAYVKESGRGIGDALWTKIVAWADGEKIGRKGGDYKKANLPFGEAILREAPEVVERVVGETEEWAARFIKAMKSEGSADKVVEIVNRRLDHNSAPERKPLNPRADYTVEKAPNRKKSGGNFDD